MFCYSNLLAVKQKNPFSQSVIGTLITIGDARVSIAIYSFFFYFFGLCSYGIWTLSKNADSFTATSFFHTVLQGWQKRVTLRKNFSTQKASMSYSNLYHQTIGKWTTKTLRLSTVEQIIEGLFSFGHPENHQEDSIGSVKKETIANNKKASKRDIVVVVDKYFLARHCEMEGMWVCAREYYCYIHPKGTLPWGVIKISAPQSPVTIKAAPSFSDCCYLTAFTLYKQPRRRKKTSHVIK